jgi:hypothetical protein
MGNGDGDRNLARQALADVAYWRGQATYAARAISKKVAFHTRAIETGNTAGSDDMTRHVGFNNYADRSLITSAPAPGSLCHRLVTLLETLMVSGKVNEKQLAIYTEAQQQAISRKAATEDAND